jgi:capsular polysaccharide transport system permease protein
MAATAALGKANVSRMSQLELKAARDLGTRKGPQQAGPLAILGRSLPVLRSRTDAIGQFATTHAPAGRLKKSWPFLLLVALPTIATALYLFLIASNQYISEARFVVRSAQKQGASGIGALLQNSGLSGMRDDVYPVVDFLKSRDALRELEAKLPLREMLNRNGADFLARFPAFYSEGSFEELYEHLSGILAVTHDASTGITTLKVRAFDAADSQRIAVALIESSEHLVNRMNERSLSDAVSLAQTQVAAAEERLKKAQQAITAYQIRFGLVDTSSTAKTYLELIGGMEKELSATRAQISQTRAMSPNNPGIQSLLDREAALSRQIDAERAKLLGSDGSLVGTFAEFQRLTLDADFAAKALLATNTLLESARMEALRKQLYLERVVEPNAADRSRYPRRWLALLTVFGACFLTFGIIRLLMVNAREHAS